MEPHGPRPRLPRCDRRRVPAAAVRSAHRAVQDPQVKKALEGFAYLRIDVGRFDKHQIVMGEYVDAFVIPALVILDADGNRIVHLSPTLYEDKAKRRNDPHRLAEALRSAGR